jgi:serine/threonine protein kinase
MDEAFPKGTVIDGRYEVRERLGQGGMGTVYRALDTKLGQMVALKVLLHTAGSEKSKEERRRRFMREIYAINEVQHRNVVHIQEFGFVKDTPYMVMELLKGQDLNHILRESTELLAVDHAVDLMLPVCAAIQACHDAGVIHRDLKPGNIMVIESDFAAGWDIKVVDFSISKVATEMTQEGQILGTPQYLSPEQVAGKVSPASDQYAIALLLYVCLTKQHPYKGLQGLPLVRAIEKGEFKKPREFRPEIPEELEQIIVTAMSVDPERRFASVHALGQKLWPFGSVLGQGVWKKYYVQTPPLGRVRPEFKDSTVNVPLVLKMAEGKVPLQAATVVAHYQSTTAVKAESKTNVDLDAGPVAIQSVEVELSSSPSEAVKTVEDREARPVAGLGPSAPSGWQWEQSSASVPAAVEGPARKRFGIARTLAIALGIGIFAGGAITVTRALSRPTHQASPPVVNVASTATPAPPPVAAAAVAAPAAPVKSAPIVPASAAAGAPAPALEVAQKGDRAEKPRGRDHEGHKRRPKADEWKVDAEGIPIPP